MRRADRLFAIIQALRGGRLRTASWLAGRLEVAQRTIYRDIADLQAHGAPVEGERGVGYLLRDEFFLPPLALTPLELEALGWGVALAAAHGDEALAAAAREVLVKLGVGAARLPIYAAIPYGSVQREMLRKAREALARSERVAIVYRDGAGLESVRVVRPLGLEHWGKVWTVTAWCELRGDFRVFRVDRIRNCHKGAAFQPEPGKRMADYLGEIAKKPEHAHSSGP